MIWTLTALSIFGVILNIKKNKTCFIVWAITNFTWAVIDFYKGIPEQGALFSVYFILALYGLWEWKKDARESKTISE
jgi:nicotinamide riboside transporter PnuC